MAQRETISQEVCERLSRWYPPELVGGTRVLRGSLFGWVFGRFGQGAVTINGTVHFTPLAPDVRTRWGTALLGHELFHVEQQARMGWWRFLLRYALSWRPGQVRNGGSHPLEAPAYRRGEEVYKALGE